MGPILEIGTVDSTGEIGKKKMEEAMIIYQQKGREKKADNDLRIGTKWSIILSTI